MVENTGPSRGTATPLGGVGADEELSLALRSAAAGRFDILGELGRSPAGRVIYLAREVATAGLVALHLEGERGDYVLDVVRSTDGSQPVPHLRPPAPAPVAAPAPVLALAQPTATRLAPQEVLLPADQVPADEALPVRPASKLPRWAIPVGVAAAVLLLALAIFLHARLTAPDATESNGVVAASAAGGRATTALVEIAAQLPRGTRLTVDGIAWQPPGVSLPPGTYTLGAEAPGYAPVTEQQTLTAGQRLAWSPVLVALHEARAAAAAARPVEHRSRAEAKRTRAAAASTTGQPAAPPAVAATCASAFAAKDWTSASTLCAHDAQSGDVTAERNLATMYQQGLGVSKDPSQAFAWMRRAADAGSRDAATQVAQMYESGHGVAKDAPQATTWYRKAALLGDPEAQVKTGMAYENGTGVDVSVTEAVGWYQKAAAQGNAWAENRLGWLYGMGNGVHRDDALALKYFRTAADQGDAQAEFNVGFMYANGRGVPRDDAQAVTWYRKAAAHGYAGAVKELRQRGLTP